MSKRYLVMCNYTDGDGYQHKKLYIKKVFLNENVAAYYLKKKLDEEYPEDFWYEDGERDILKDGLITIKSQNRSYYDFDIWIKELDYCETIYD